MYFVRNYLWRRNVKTIKPFGRRLPPESLRLHLCDVDANVADAWIDTFRDLDAVEILHGNLLDLEVDALVSPANSFGDMSGGIDKHIDDYYNGAAQPAAVAAIREHPMGELPVGAALIVATPRPRFPLLVVAPTTRTPGNVATTLNAYLALRAALVAVLRYNFGAERKIARLSVPGLCTGVGGMSPGLSARQMRAAYDNVIAGEWKSVIHPAMAPFALGASSGNGGPGETPPENRRKNGGQPSLLLAELLPMLIPAWIIQIWRKQHSIRSS